MKLDSLSHIAWNHVIQLDAVEAIIKAMVEGPAAFMENYACSAKA